MTIVVLSLILGAVYLSSAKLTIRCDVDGRIETILGINLAANYLPCKHTICDRHARFTPEGYWLCPIDGKHGGPQ